MDSVSIRLALFQTPSLREFTPRVHLAASGVVGDGAKRVFAGGHGEVAKNDVELPPTAAALSAGPITLSTNADRRSDQHGLIASDSQWDRHNRFRVLSDKGSKSLDPQSSDTVTPSRSTDR